MMMMMMAMQCAFEEYKGVELTIVMELAAPLNLLPLEMKRRSWLTNPPSTINRINRNNFFEEVSKRREQCAILIKNYS